MDDRLQAMARQAVADTPREDGRVPKLQAVKLLRERDGKQGRMQDYIEAVTWALEHPTAASLPIDSIVARTHVVYIKSMPSEWYSTNGTKRTDEDIDRFLTGERWARVLRVGDGKD